MYCFHLGVCQLAYILKVDRTESIGNIAYVSTARDLIPLPLFDLIPLRNLICIHDLSIKNH